MKTISKDGAYVVTAYVEANRMGRSHPLCIYADNQRIVRKYMEPRGYRLHELVAAESEPLLLRAGTVITASYGHDPLTELSADHITVTRRTTITSRQR